MNNKFIFIFGLLFIFLLFTAYAEALSITPSLKIDTIYCTVNEEISLNEETCLDDTCTLYLVDLNDRWDLPYWIPLLEIKDINERNEGVWLGTLNHTKAGFHLKRGAIDYFLDSSVKVCEEDTAGIEEAIYNITGRSTNRAYGLTIIPYDIEVESSWIEQNNDILNCHYVEYKATDSWLVRTPDIMKDYCVVASGYFVQNRQSRISPTLFFSYIVSNPSETTVPYTVMIIVVILIIFGFLYKISKHNQGSFIPNAWKVWISILIAYLFALGFGFDNYVWDFILLLLFSYTLICLLSIFTSEKIISALKSKKALQSIIAIVFAIYLGLGFSIDFMSFFSIDYVSLIKYAVIFFLYYLACNFVILQWRFANNADKMESLSTFSKVASFLVKIAITPVLAVFFSAIAIQYFEWLIAIIFMVYYWLVEFLVFLSIAIERSAGRLLGRK